MTGDPRPPRWPTALVVLGTLSLVALVLVTVGLQSSVRSGSDSIATTPAATPSAAPTTGPASSAEAAASPTATAPGGEEGATTGGAPAAGATPGGQPRATGAPDLADPTVVTSDVDVLNQTLTEGLAGRAALVVEQRGWPVERVDNATLGTPATTVYVPVGLEAAGDAFVQVFPEVTRTRPAFEGLAVDRLTLVLAEPDALAVVTAMEAAGVPAT